MEDSRLNAPEAVVEALIDYLDNYDIDANTKDARKIDDPNERQYSDEELDKLEQVRYWVYGDQLLEDPWETPTGLAATKDDYPDM